MARLALVLERFLADKAVQATAAVGGRDRVSIGFAQAAGVLALAGVGFFIWASHLWLVAHYPPDVAVALTGAAAFLAALLASMFSFGILSYRRSRVRTLRREVKRSLHEICEMIDAFIADPVRDNPKTAAIAATIAGFMMGERSFDRHGNRN